MGNPKRKDGPSPAEVTEIALPGVGVRYEFVTEGGERLGVVHHRTGRRELLLYDTEDTDACREVIDLGEQDSRVLAELLGGSRIAEQLARLQQSVEGLVIDWLRVEPGSPFAGRTIGQSAARTRTGSSIVAVIRGEEALPAPGPDFALAPEDTLLVVGTGHGIEALARLLRSG